MIILFIGCSPSSEIKEISISTVDYDIETPIAVKCQDFFNFFSKELDTRMVIDNGEKNLFLSEMAKLKKYEEGYPDARAEVFLKYKNRTDTICADRFLLKIGDQCYEMSDRMRQLIWRDNK